MSDWEGPLDALRWHWGGAYLISFFEPDVWVAQRRDNRETLRADNPEDLRDLIAEQLGIRTIAVYSDADADAQHVRQADVQVPGRRQHGSGVAFGGVLMGKLADRYGIAHAAGA